MTWLDYHYFRLSSVKTPKSVLRFGRLSTKSLAILTSSSLSTRLSFEFKIANALDLRSVIVECSQVLILLAMENDLSGVAVVAP